MKALLWSLPLLVAGRQHSRHVPENDIGVESTTANTASVLEFNDYDADHPLLDMDQYNDQEVQSIHPAGKVRQCRTGLEHEAMNDALEKGFQNEGAQDHYVEIHEKVSEILVCPVPRPLSGSLKSE